MCTTPGSFTAAIEFLLLFARGARLPFRFVRPGQFAVLDLDREFRKFAWLALDTAAGCSVEFPFVMMAG